MGVRLAALVVCLSLVMGPSTMLATAAARDNWQDWARLQRDYVDLTEEKPKSSDRTGRRKWLERRSAIQIRALDLLLSTMDAKVDPAGPRSRIFDKVMSGRWNGQVKERASHVREEISQRVQRARSPTELSRLYRYFLISAQAHPPQTNGATASAVATKLRELEADLHRIDTATLAYLRKREIGRLPKRIGRGDAESHVKRIVYALPEHALTPELFPRLFTQILDGVRARVRGSQPPPLVLSPFEQGLIEEALDSTVDPASSEARPGGTTSLEAALRRWALHASRAGALADSPRRTIEDARRAHQQARKRYDHDSMEAEQCDQLLVALNALLRAKRASDSDARQREIARVEKARRAANELGVRRGRERHRTLLAKRPRGVKVLNIGGPLLGDDYPRYGRSDFRHFDVRLWDRRTVVGDANDPTQLSRALGKKIRLVRATGVPFLGGNELAGGVNADLFARQVAEAQVPHIVARTGCQAVLGRALQKHGYDVRIRRFSGGTSYLTARPRSEK